MLAMANQFGEVEASIPGLAVLAGVSTGECKASLDTLLAPDEFSRTTEHQGRRIEAIEGGWRLLNHAKYRAKMNEDDRREYLRRKQQEHRAKGKSVNNLSTNVNKCQSRSTPSTQSEAYSESESKAKAGGASERAFPEVSRPTEKEVLEYAVNTIGLAEWKARDWFHEMEGCGWLDYQKRPIEKWQSVLARVRTKWEADGRPKSPPISKSNAPKEIRRTLADDNIDALKRQLENL